MSHGDVRESFIIDSCVRDSFMSVTHSWLIYVIHLDGVGVTSINKSRTKPSVRWQHRRRDYKKDVSKWYTKKFYYFFFWKGPTWMQRDRQRNGSTNSETLLRDLLDDLRKWAIKETYIDEIKPWQGWQQRPRGESNISHVSNMNEFTSI